jgi:ubiquinone/menaquinone biosynthesis C-methylase UbiE
LQQIISTIEVSDLRLKALREAYRVLEKDGTALFSFLSFESKQNDRLFKLVYPSIKFFRFLKRKKTNCQYIPWLKFSGKINFKAIFDIGPYNYWYRKDEVFSLLKEIGFNIVYYGYPIDIAKGSKLNIREISGVNSNMGHLYVVCKKI